MSPGETGRNAAVSIGYVILLVVLASSRLLLLAIPIVVAYAVVKNYRGTADRLTRLPGIAPEGGMKVAVVAVLYGLVLMFVVGTGLAAVAGPVDEPDPLTTTLPEATPSTVTTAVTSTVPSTAGATQTAPSTASMTATATDSPAPTAAARGPQEGTEWTVTITRVIDGDTMEVEFPNGEIDTLRLLGVDTPETTYSRVSPDEFDGIPDNTAGRDHLFNWGEQATEFAKTQLAGKTVRIEVDEQADRRGSFGRLLVYVYVGGEDFNRMLLDRGYARMYDSSFSKRSEYRAAESNAQVNDIGLWDIKEPTATSAPEPTATSTPTPEPTPTATEKTSEGDSSDDKSGEGELVVAKAHYDAPGDDHENLNEEYIVFENTGDAPLEMGGWTVSDEVDHEYTIPAGFTLGPGETVTLYTGSGTNTDSALYWGSGRAIWNNGGDTIYVRDGGQLVLEYSY